MHIRDVRIVARSNRSRSAGTTTAVARRPAEVRQLGPWWLTPHLEIPTARQDNLTRPVEYMVRPRAAQQMAWFDINDQRHIPVASNKKVRNVTSPLSSHSGSEQEGLSPDAGHVLVEVSVEQARQLKPRLINHMIPHRGGPVRARVVLLPVPPAKRPPWPRRAKIIDTRRSPRPTLLHRPVCMTQTYGNFTNDVLHAPPPSSRGPTWRRPRSADMHQGHAREHLCEGRKHEPHRYERTIGHSSVSRCCPLGQWEATRCEKRTSEMGTYTRHPGRSAPAPLLVEA